MPVRLSIDVDTKALRKKLSAFAQKQLPYAISETVNAVAATVIAEESKAIGDTFNQPRPFTVNAFTQAKHFGGMRASKHFPTAVIVAKPAQDAYLAPSQFNEPQALGRGRRIRTPVGIKTGPGGNIPRDAIRRLLSQPDVFLAVVSGVNGLWQRPSKPAPRLKGAPRAKGLKRNTTGRLKLLVAFTRPVRLRTHLRFYERANAIVQAAIPIAFSANLARAMATAR